MIIRCDPQRRPLDRTAARSRKQTPAHRAEEQSVDAHLRGKLALLRGGLERRARSRQRRARHLDGRTGHRQSDPTHLPQRASLRLLAGPVSRQSNRMCLQRAKCFGVAFSGWWILGFHLQVTRGDAISTTPSSATAERGAVTAKVERTCLRSSASSPRDEAELQGQLRYQAGAW